MIALFTRPLSFRAQLLLTFAGVLLLSQVINFYVLEYNRSLVQDFKSRSHAVDRLQSLINTLNTTPPDLQQSMLVAASHSLAHYQLDTEPAIGATESIEQELVAKLAGILNLPLSHIRARYLPQGDDCREWPPQQADARVKTEHSTYFVQTRKICPETLVVSINLGEKHWLNAHISVFTSHLESLGGVWKSVILAPALILLIVFYLVSRITDSLRDLSRGSQRVGRGEIVDAIKLRGPKDVQVAIDAFNTMQERVRAHTQDRSRLLAAISHDLRSPITSMRLRVELMEDGEDKSKLLGTLSEMEDITSASLDFLRESTINEATEDVDLNALLMSLCDDMIDQGLSVHYQETVRSVYRCRRSALKRALVNIINNATKYGESAEVRLGSTASTYEIQVSDKGPGISNKDVERVFEPFVRLEYSRNRETGGIGLGLAIARSIVRNHGGDIVIEPAQSEQDFYMRITLPKSDIEEPLPQ